MKFFVSVEYQSHFCETSLFALSPRVFDSLVRLTHLLRHTSELHLGKKYPIQKTPNKSIKIAGETLVLWMDPGRASIQFQMA